HLGDRAGRGLVPSDRDSRPASRGGERPALRRLADDLVRPEDLAGIRRAADHARLAHVCELVAVRTALLGMLSPPRRAPPAPERRRRDVLTLASAAKRRLRVPRAARHREPRKRRTSWASALSAAATAGGSGANGASATVPPARLHVATARPSTRANGRNRPLTVTTLVAAPRTSSLATQP